MLGIVDRPVQRQARTGDEAGGSGFVGGDDPVDKGLFVFVRAALQHSEGLAGDDGSRGDAGLEADFDGFIRLAPVGAPADEKLRDSGIGDQVQLES